jgi:transcriptional regulator with XRE-family HTH domain
MDDQRFGAAVRAARLRRGWRQRTVALEAGVSQATVSRLERGFIDQLSMATVRSVARVLEVRVELLPRSRGADLDRLVNARHAALAEAAIGRFAPGLGWTVRPEVSFAWYGERGVIDLFASHRATGALLVIELKTAIVDVGEILATLDRKRRLASVAARELGWQAGSVSVALLIAEGITNRRAVAAHRATFRAALPDDGRGFWRWLARPDRRIQAAAFLSPSHPGTVRSRSQATIRVSAMRERLAERAGPTA